MIFNSTHSKHYHFRHTINIKLLSTFIIFFFFPFKFLKSDVYFTLTPHPQFGLATFQEPLAVTILQAHIMIFRNLKRKREKFLIEFKKPCGVIRICILDYDY